MGPVTEDKAAALIVVDLPTSHPVLAHCPAAYSTGALSYVIAPDVPPLAIVFDHCLIGPTWA